MKKPLKAAWDIHCIYGCSPGRILLAMELLAVLWFGGLLALVHYTSEAQRQLMLLICWGLLCLPILGWLSLWLWRLFAP
jgi:hypothetical protein